MLAKEARIRTTLTLNGKDATSRYFMILKAN